MPKESAGLLVYRETDRDLEVLIAHPGGPFFARKDDGAWTVPKGEPCSGEALLDCAIREFKEELGIDPPSSAYLPLGTVTQKGGKTIHAWACPGSLDEGALESNTFELEWPPKSGRVQRFAEIDRVAFVSLETARKKLNPAQVPLIDRLREHVHKPM